MSKDKITDYSTTAASNTDIGGVFIGEGCAFGNMNDFGRMIAKHLADMNAGTHPLADTVTFGDPADLTKQFRLDAGSITTASTRVITVPDRTGTMVLTDGAQDLASKTFVDSSDTSKKLAFSLSGITTATTRTVTWPDVSGTVYLSTNFATSFPTLVSMEAISLAAGDLLYASAADTVVRLPIGSSGQVLTVTGGLPDWETTSTSRTPDFVLEDQKTSGTNGGSSVATTWTVRALNTEVYDPNSYVTIISNEFIPTVSGWVEWSSPFSGSTAKTRLYNATDATIVGYGTAVYVGSFAASTGGAYVAAGKAYRVEYYSGTATASTGLGSAAGGGTEVYTRVLFWKA